MNRIDALKKIAAQLGMPDYTWLDKLISFESLWNPKAKNVLSGARGLIQFTNTTAKALGFKNADDLVNRYPDEISQLTQPVFRYLKKYAPFPTAQSLYMSVFYPAARSWNLTVRFPAGIINKNPGITTVGDYVRKVNRRRVSPVVVVVVLMLASALLYTYYNTRGVKWIDNAKETQMIG
jgi:hypothetical protein